MFVFVQKLLMTTFILQKNVYPPPLRQFFRKKRLKNIVLNFFLIVALKISSRAFSIRFITLVFIYSTIFNIISIGLMSHPPQKNLRKQNSQKKVADSQEVTPLFAATTSGHEEIVQYLVIQSQNCKFKKEPDLETLAPHVSQKNSSSSLIISNWMVHLSYFMVTRSPFLSFFSLLMVFDV